MPEGGLAIIERAHRGAVEAQFYDTLFIAVLFKSSLGGLDLLLRGMAVTYALTEARTPDLRLGDRTVTTLSDPQAGLRNLIDERTSVYVEEQDLAALGRSAADLIPGVRPICGTVLATRWPEYAQVLYL
jgi:hypothetical protein